MPDIELRDALHRIRSLRSKLQQISDKDQEQEVQGVALPVVDTVVSAARQWIPEGDPVLDSVSDVISVETIEAGEAIRAIDMLIVVDQLEHVLSGLYNEETGPITLRREPGLFDN